MKFGEGREERLPPEWMARWSVLRVLYMDRRFRWLLMGVCVAMGLGVASVTRCIPGHRWPDGRSWRMTGWDWVQREGLRWGWLGEDPREHVANWRRRVELDPADPVALRGYVEALTREAGEGREHREQSRDWGGWLLRVGGTNGADVARVLRLGMASGTDWTVVEELGPHLGRMEAGDRALAVQVLAEAGRWREVGRLVETVGETEVDPALRLHRWAWEAGWGGKAGALEGLKRLREAAKAGDEGGGLAKRLLLRVLVERSEVGEADRVLEELRGGGGIRMSDGLVWAWARQRLGGGGTWRQAVQGWAGPVRSEEWKSWVELLRALGEPNRARRELEQGLVRWGGRAEWIWLADLSVEDGDWRGLRRAGVGLRGFPGGDDGTAAMGWAMEAMAQERLGAAEEARLAWDRSGRERSPAGRMAWEWGRRVAGWGWPREGWDWLLRAEEQMEGRLEYWRVRLRAAHGMGDGEAILEGAQRVRVLTPTDPNSANELAAALLVLRQEPMEALRLAREAREARGAVEARAGRVNEALALVQLGNWAEAARALEALELEGLTGIERTMVCLGRFDMHAGTGQVTEALEAYKGMDAGHLLPVQLRWLERQYAGLMRPEKEGGTRDRIQTP